MSTRQLILGTIALGAIVATPIGAHAGHLFIGTGDGTSCTLTLQEPAPFTVHVVYLPVEGNDYIIAADFRIEGIPTEGIFYTTVHNPAAIVSTGNPRDGMHVEFPSCMQSIVLLATITGFWAAAPPTYHSWVTRGIVGGDSCPLVRYCGESAAVPIRAGHLVVNPPKPYPDPCIEDCSTIAVDGGTWSAVKSIYR